MADYFLKILHSLRNCNVASSPALRLGGASEQLSGLCFQNSIGPSPNYATITPYSTMGCLKMLWFRQSSRHASFLVWLVWWLAILKTQCLDSFNKTFLLFYLQQFPRLVGTWKPQASQGTTDNTSSGSESSEIICVCDWKWSASVMWSSGSDHLKSVVSCD